MIPRRILKILFLMLSPAMLSSHHLKVYIEDSHSGAFYYIIENMSHHDEYLLINLDAHPDTKEHPDYRRLREGSLFSDLKSLRQLETIQCYNWIHSLVPKPVSEIIWVPFIRLNNNNLHKLNQNYKIRSIENSVYNWFQTDSNFHISSLYKLASLVHKFEKKIISLDLDFFSGSKHMENDIPFVMDYICRISGAEHLIIAISYAYLQDTKELNVILYETFSYLVRLPTVKTIQFEPFIAQLNDSSYKQKNQKPEDVKIFSLRLINRPLKKLWKEHRKKIRVNHNKRGWNYYLERP